MSGGFFRGTSADQDTRFSNKQAKLLKSQKFAPELEHPVDMGKVKMDVMKPWIAKRVTELIGFEDEVLINFIYGLLEGKEVNGKEVQIQLTGFMERNTGKFMKELWSLLLSAQMNSSGVPQPFLDAKEEETKKKKAEKDRIANEISRKKEQEKQKLEQEKDKVDGDGNISRYGNAGQNSKQHPRFSIPQSADERGHGMKNGRRGRNRVSQSPDSANHSPSSSERRRSRSISGSPPPRGRSISSERPRRSSPIQSGTPITRHSPSLSPPPRYRSTLSGRRSRSCSRQMSPSPVRYRVRSPLRHRSRSSLRRRSRSPLRRRSRSPLRRRSRSPLRRRSRTPLRRRSRTPLRRRSRSPMWRRSRTPVRRSPVRYRSRSPVQCRSPPPMRRRSPSPPHRRLPSPRRSSPSPHRRSPSPRRRSLSPLRRRHRRSPSTPQRQSISPGQHRLLVSVRRSITPVKRRSPMVHESSSPSPRSQSPRTWKSPLSSPRAAIRPLVSLRSPQRDTLDRENTRARVLDPSHPLHKSPSVSDVSGERSPSEQRRSSSPHGSPYQRREKITYLASPTPLSKEIGSKPRRDSYGTNADERETGEHKHRSSVKRSPPDERHKESLRFADPKKSRKPPQPRESEKLPETVDHIVNPAQKESLLIHKGTVLREKGNESYVVDDRRASDKNRPLFDVAKGSDQYSEQVLPKLSRADEQNARSGSMGFDTKEADKHKTKVKEKRKHKRSERQEVESDEYSGYDSYEERKEAKRRKKEEKRLKKEERHQRREERRRRRKEKHAEKLKLKSLDSGSPSTDNERDHDRHASDDEGYRRQESRICDVEGTESEQKKLEIELREKALESLRAKKSAHT